MNGYMSFELTVHSLVFCSSIVSVGQSFFTESRPPTASLGGTEVWFGYHQRAVISMWKTVLLNVDREYVYI